MQNRPLESSSKLKLVPIWETSFKAFDDGLNLEMLRLCTIIGALKLKINRKKKFWSFDVGRDLFCCCYFRIKNQQEKIFGFSNRIYVCLFMYSLLYN